MLSAAQMKIQINAFVEFKRKAEVTDAAPSHVPLPATLRKRSQQVCKAHQYRAKRELTQS